MAEKSKIQTITLEPPVNGLVSEFSPIANPIEGGKGQYRYAFGTTTIRPGYKGHIAPAEIFNATSVTDSSVRLTSLPRAVAVDNSQTPNVEWYMCGGTSGTAPRVVQVTSGAVTNYFDISAGGNNFTTLPTQGTGFWGEDILFYTGLQSTTTPTRMILYSYNDSGKGGVGMYSIESSSVVSDNFFSGSDGGSYFPGSGINPIKNVPHRMCIGPDQIVYMTNGNYIASYDATADQSGGNGTYNNQALALTQGWVAVDVQPYQNYIAIAMVKTGTLYNSPLENCEARVVLWDGFSLDFNQVYNLDDWYVNSVFAKNGVLYAFTQGSNGTTKVKALPLGFPTFETIFEMPTSYVGNAPLPNQVEYFHDRITWVSSTQQVFSIEQTKDGYSTHVAYYVSSGLAGGVAVGFLKNVHDNYLFAGFHASNGATYQIIGAEGDGAGNSMISTLAPASTYIEHRICLEDIGYKNNLNKIIVYFSSFGANSSALISVIPNRTPYSLDGSNNPVGDELGWVISTALHPNITTYMAASTSEIPKSLIDANLSQFWMNIRLTNTDKTATPPIIRKIDLIIGVADNP